jgi:3-hydroxyacyl-[acyl-carrier-protein] dehydratase
MQLLKEDILKLIPHRPPMLLVDEVVECNARRIVARKTFTGQEAFFQGHFPGAAILPGVVLCEVGMQCGAILLSRWFAAWPPDGIPVATRLNQVKFKQAVRPGDTIEIDVELKEQLDKAFFLHARVRRGGKLAATFDFACTFMARPQERPKSTG